MAIRLTSKSAMGLVKIVYTMIFILTIFTHSAQAQCEFFVTCPLEQEEVDCVSLLPTDVPTGDDILGTFESLGGSWTATAGCNTVVGTVTALEDVIECPQTTRTWQFFIFADIDGSGAQNGEEPGMLCDVNFIAFDDTPPVLEGAGPDGTYVCGTDPVFVAPTVSDECGEMPEIVAVIEETEGECGPTFMATWTTMDACGNEAIPVTQTLVAEDTESPILEGGGADGTYVCDEDPVFTAPTVSDACDEMVELVEEITSVDGECGPTYTATWTAVDACGNEAIPVSQTLTADDTVAPVLEGQGADGTVPCGDPVLFSPPVVTDNCDDEILFDFTDEVVGEPCSAITRTWTAIDACGNEAIPVSQTIEIIDEDPPVLAGIGADGMYECTTAPVFSEPTATDNCTEVTITFEDEEIGSNCAGPIIQRTWTATDICGNTDEGSQTMTPIDETGPVFTSVQADGTYLCGELPVFTDPVAVDACDDADPVIAFTEEIIPENCVGDVIIRTWTAIDACGNETEVEVTMTPIADTAPPVLVSDAPENLFFECFDEITPPPADPLVTDDCDPAPDLVFETTFDPVAPECQDNTTVFVRTWTYTDFCDNVLVVRQLVVVSSLMVPEFNEDPLPADMEVQCDAVPPKDVLTTMTTCGEMLEVECVETFVPGCAEYAGVLTRTWEAVDCAGNIVTHVQTINVVDDTDPEIICPADITLECGDRLLAFEIRDWLESATITDNCDDHVVLTTDYTAPPEYDCIGSEEGLVVTFTATDECGNTAECTANLTIVDDLAPVINVCPADLELTCGDYRNDYLIEQWLASFAAEDQCSEVTLTNDFDEIPDVDCAAAAPVTVTFTATDECGNIEECTAELIVVDAEAPQIICPVDLTLECMDTDNPVKILDWLASVSASDDCELIDVTNDYGGVPPAPDCGVIGLVVNFTATDGCGNISECAAEIYMDDTQAPEIECPSDITIEIDNDVDCEATVTWDLPTAEDLCDGVLVPTIVPGDIDLGDVVAPGNYVVCYEAEDACGNVGDCCFRVTVKEYQPDGLACKNINVSLNEDCEGLVTPEMVLANDDIGCPDNYVIQIWDPHGNLLDNTLDDAFLGQTLNYMICLPVCDFCCWGEISIEDKFAPVIECEEVFTTTCNGLENIAPPIAVENCSTYTVELINEEVDLLPCDPLYTKIVRRTYVAVDASGYESAVPCTQTIYLERAIITAINFPDNTSLYCDANYKTDDNGFPDPSESGVPTNIDGDPFFPDIPDELCNVLVTYTDEIVASTDCKTKILRTWQINEWHCTGETSFGGPQFIEIIDQNGPTFDAPDDMTVTTGYGCVANVPLPSVDATDACSNISSYFIEYPGGALGQNGGYAEMPVGHHEVNFIVYDDCYNSSEKHFYVTVEDNTQPVALCEQNTVVSIPHTGSVEVLAEVFDDGSTDDCGVHLFEVRRMDFWCVDEDEEWGPTVEFCCSDVGRDDIMVALRVTDYNGATNICMVNVQTQDKVAPSIVCPDDATIFCDEPYDLTALGRTFGEPVVTGNCDDELFSEETDAEVDQCGLGQILRHFSVTDEDGNIVESCTQKISIINNTPYDGGLIVWPQNYETTECASADQFDPEDLDPPFDRPTYEEETCDLLGENYTDEVFEFVQGAEACLKIIRKWTVIDWCQTYYDADGNRNFKTWTRDQEIKVHDLVDPIIDACQDTMICTFDINCDPGLVTLFANATDNCTPVDQMYWRYEVDENSDGDIDYAEEGNVITERFTLGVHRIRWIAEDRCGNLDFCEYNVEIVNCKAPTPVCIQGLSVDLVPMDLVGNDGVPDDEMATIWASDFDASSFHNCGNNITFSFSPDTTDTSIVFDCDDLGLNVVQMWVTDRITGTQDFCETYIDVQDNNDIDICPEETVGPISSVAGRIYTEENERIENVMVELTGYMQNMDMTNQQGGYVFDDIITGEDYIIDPYKNDDPLNGVSTLDLVMIQRHILGIDNLNSPYKLIAADINSDDGISAIDLIELRKLILGVYPNFPNNESWRFIDSAHEFSNDNNPWSAFFDEDYDIDNLSQDMLIDFIGVKTGDVNNSVTLNLSNDPKIDSRSDQTISLQTENMSLRSGESYQIDLKVSQEFSVAGLQFTLNTNNAIITKVESDNFIIDNSNIGKISDFVTTVSLHDEQIQDLEEGSILMSIEIEALEDVELKDVIQISSSVTKAEIYNESFEVFGLALDFEVNEDKVSLSQNQPNPWKGETEIMFYLPVSTNINLNFYNVDGKMLHNIEGFYEAGSHTVNVSSDQMGNSGVVFYELIVNSERLNKKMIILE